MTIGDKIKKLSEEKDKTFYRIAKDSDISESYLSDLVNNKKFNPSLKILKKIANGLGVEITELIKEE
jgi:transcriptional regulator with XRE-family HTH domain